MVDSKEGSLNVGSSDELHSYIADGLKKGYSLQELRKDLRNQGVRGRDIRRALRPFSPRSSIRTIVISLSVIILVLLVGAGVYFGISLSHTGSPAVVKTGSNDSENTGASFNVGVLIQNDNSPFANYTSPMQCSKYQSSPAMNLFCQVYVSTNTNSSRFCTLLSKYGSPVHLVPYNSTRTSTVYLLSPPEFCWMLLSVRTGTDYCNNLTNHTLNTLCMRDGGFV